MREDNGSYAGPGWTPDGAYGIEGVRGQVFLMSSSGPSRAAHRVADQSRPRKP